MKVQGNYAYCASYNLGFQIINVTDPTNLEHVASLTDGNYSKSIDVLGEYAFMAANNGGLQVINVSDVLNPEYLYIDKQAGYAYDVCATPSGVVFLGNGYGGLYAYNITNITNIQLIDNVDPGGFGFDIAVEGQYIYYTAAENGVYIYEWTESSTLLQVGHYYDEDGKAYDVEVINGTLFVADSFGGIEVLLHDNDQDGLANHLEQVYYGTDINNKDTDGDLLSDYEEIYDWQTDPTNPDTDGDG
ncbi:MAG: hypothetical protein ACTSWT_04700, partial [Candidatus Heimdallarchaeota archaeon]